MQLHFCCEVCEEPQQHELFQMIDLISNPELIDQLKQGCLTQFACKFCDTPNDWGQRTNFIVWLPQWVGVVLPCRQGSLIEHAPIITRFLLEYYRPKRKRLPTKVRVFNSAIKLFEAIAVK